MKNIPVYAWDNGFGSEKFFTQIEEAPGKDVYKKLAFPSVTLKMDVKSESTSGISLFNKDFSLEKMILEYQDNTYAIGKYAIAQDEKGVNRTFVRNKFQETTETMKLLASLILMFPQEEYFIIDDLALGLSLESWHQYHREVEKHFAHQSFLFKYLTRDGMRVAKAEIGEVHCSQQGYGAFWDAYLEISEDGHIRFSNKNIITNKKQRFGICDVGDKTIDANCFVGVEPIFNTEVKFDNGISEAYKRVATKLNNCPEILIEETYLDYIYGHPDKRPLYWSGRYYTIEEIKPLCEEAFREIGGQIVNTVMKKWSKQLDTLEFVVLCGGAANILKDLFEEKFHRPVITVEDPQYANVRGYFKSRIFLLQLNEKRVQNG